MGNTSSTPAFSIPFQRTTAQDICQKKLMPFLLADGAGFFRQCQVWNIVVSNANVLNFHMQSPLLVDTAIVQKEECFVECTKPPVLRKTKPGTHAQSIISLMKIKNPNPFPIGNKFGFFICGGDCWTRTSDLLRVKIRCAPESVAPQRFPALLRAFGSVGDPLCPPVSTCFFPCLGHGLGQALRRCRNDHAVIKE